MSKLHLTTILFLLILGLTACTYNPAGRRQSETTAAVDTPLRLSDGPALLERPCNVYLPKGEVEGETIVCGYVRMPWHRANSVKDNTGDATTDLAYVILKATGGNPNPNAIVHISGGPGIGATLRDVVPELVKRYAPLRSDHDIVLYDQRGMGNSRPFFECPYPNEAQATKLRDQLVVTATEDVSEEDIQNAFCQQDLTTSGLPAAGISTANSAADLVDVMAALGYPAYDLYAISYGTRLAMSLTHHFPDHPLVRSIVLDSAYPLPEDKVNDYLASTSLYQQALFEAVFRACTDDPACATAYPDLRNRFNDLVATLATSPLDLGDGEIFRNDDLYRVAYPFNMALNYIPYQPRLIAELEQGDTTTLALLRSGQVPTRDVITGVGPDADAFSDLMELFLACSADVTDGDAMEVALVALWDAEVDAVQVAVSELCPGDNAVAVNELLGTMPLQAFNGIIARFAPETVQGVNSALNSKLNCTEQYPFAEETGTIEAALLAGDLPDFFVEETMATMASRGQGCSAWSDALTEPTPSAYGDYPVLILSGQYDSITPPEMARIAAAELSNAQLVTVPNAMHSILGNHGDCPTQLVQQFLANPEQPVDAACTEEMSVQWVMLDDPLPSGQSQ